MNEKVEVWSRRTAPVDYQEAKPMPTMVPESLSEYAENGVTFNVNVINTILNEVEDSLMMLRSKMDPFLYISPENSVPSEDNAVKPAVPINSALSLELQGIRHRVQGIKYLILKTIDQIDL